MYLTGIADEAGAPIETQVAAHAELGWDHIEMRNVPEGNFAEIDDDTFEAAFARLEEAGLKISCFASGIANWARPITGDFKKDLGDLRRAAERMKRAGCSIIRIMSWTNPEEAVSEQVWHDEALRRLRELAKVAEDAGIVLGHENCSGYFGETPERMQQLIDEVDSPAVGIIYDTGNPVGHGGDPRQWYRACKEHTVYVHVKDGTPPKEGEERYTFPGEGEGKVREVLSDLLESGYDGGISIEPHMAAQVHLGTTAEGDAAFNTYVEYGRRLERLIGEITGGG